MKNIKNILVHAVIAVAFISYSLSFIAYAEPKAKDTPKKDETTTEASPSAAESTATTMTAAAAAEPVSEGIVGKEMLLSPLLGESFQTDLATGAATVSIPIVVPPGRKNMQPALAISYSSNNPNGVCGVGWALTASSIQRSTKKGTPKYDNTDTFIFASSGSTGELVLIDEINNEYRQKIETSFMKYVFDDVTLKWTVWDKNGTEYLFGSSGDSRIIDPANATKIFAWYLDRVEDVYGNYLTYIYDKDASGQIYLSRIEYTSNNQTIPVLTSDKSIEFIYELARPDLIHNNRSGWEIETNRRLKEIQVKVDNSLVWRYVLDYAQSTDTDRTLLDQITLFDASGNSLPPKKFTYQTVE